ncbi:hypothetical protein PFISCL1PPCAC_21405, partial [Pristionchus fissidentatus]
RPAPLHTKMSTHFSMRRLLLLMMISTLFRCIHTIGLMECGRIFYCTVHTDCFESGSAEIAGRTGWIQYQAQYTQDTPPHREHLTGFIPTCKRYIAMNANPGLQSLRVHIQDDTLTAGTGLKMWFASAHNGGAFIQCKDYTATIQKSSTITDFAIGTQHQRDISYEKPRTPDKVFCSFDLKSSAGLKGKKMFAFFNAKASTFYIGSATEPKPTSGAVEILNGQFNGMCSKTELRPVISLKDGEPDEMRPSADADANVKGLARDLKRFEIEWSTNEDDKLGQVHGDLFQCPGDYAMYHRETHSTP